MRGELSVTLPSRADRTRRQRGIFGFVSQGPKMLTSPRTRARTESYVHSENQVRRNHRKVVGAREKRVARTQKGLTLLRTTPRGVLIVKYAKTRGIFSISATRVSPRKHIYIYLIARTSRRRERFPLWMSRARARPFRADLDIDIGVTWTAGVTT